MITSAPRLRSICITLSGVNTCFDPSMWLRNSTPSSLTVRKPLEREHLKSARVGEDRTIPPHEAMQSAEIANQLVARTQMQMIRVAENHLRAELAQIDGIERLHRRQRADRHERRRVDDAVRRRETTGAPAAGFGVDRKLEWIHVSC